MTCDDCNEIFDARSKFINHLVTHLPAKYECKECKQCFLEQIDLAHHNVMQHNYTICYTCDQTFRPNGDSEGSLGNHTCERKEETYTCNHKKCKTKFGTAKLFSVRNNFIEHLILEHKICEGDDLLAELDASTGIKNSNIKRGLKEAPTEHQLEKEGLTELFNYASFCVRNGVLYLDHENTVQEQEICGVVSKKINLPTSQMATGVTKNYNVKNFSGKKSTQSRRSGGRRVVPKSNFLGNLVDFEFTKPDKLNQGGHSSPSNNSDEMEEEEIENSSSNSSGDKRTGNFTKKSQPQVAKPYVNNQNYLSTVYNLDDDKTITSQSNRNYHSCHRTGSEDTEQDNENDDQNPIDISDSASISEASQLSIGEQLSVGGYMEQLNYGQRQNQNYNIPTYNGGYQPQHYNGNYQNGHQMSGRSNKNLKYKSAKSSRWNSNKNSASKVMDRAFQNQYFNCEIQTPDKVRDGVMDIYELGLTGEKSGSIYGGYSGSKQNRSQGKRREDSASARKNLNFNGNPAGPGREVFGDQTHFYQNQQNCDNYNSKYLRKRGKMDLHKRQDAQVCDKDFEPYYETRSSAQKNSGMKRGGGMRMEPMVEKQPLTLIQQKQSRKTRNQKRNIGELRTGPNTEGKRPIPLWGDGWNKVGQHSNGISLSNLM